METRIVGMEEFLKKGYLRDLSENWSGDQLREMAEKLGIKIGKTAGKEAIYTQIKNELESGKKVIVRLTEKEIKEMEKEERKKEREEKRKEKECPEARRSFVEDDRRRCPEEYPFFNTDKECCTSKPGYGNLRIANDSRRSKTLDPFFSRYKLIFFDLETTGLIVGDEIPEITQIAAYDPYSNEVFSRFVRPLGEIPREVSIITRIYKSNGTSEDEYYKSLDYVDVSEAREVGDVLNEFRGIFLEEDPETLIIMIAHNGDNFDNIILDKYLGGLPDNAVYFDSLNYFRVKLPLQKHNLGKLYTYYTGNEISGAHNALYDTYALYEVMVHSTGGITKEELKEELEEGDLIEAQVRAIHKAIVEYYN